MQSLQSQAYRVYLRMEAAFSIIFGIVFTCTTLYYIQVVGMTPLQLVLVGTALELSCFVFEVPTGVVADSYSRRLSVIIGTALLGVAFVAEGLLPVFGLILVTQAVRGLGHTFISGAQQAWITDEIGEANAGHAFMRASQVGQISGPVGVVIGMAMGSVNLQLGIVFGGVLMVGLAGYMLSAMPETGFKPASRGERSTWQHMTGTLRHGFGIARGNRLVLALIVTSLIMGAFSEGYDRLNEFHFLNNIGLPGGLQPVVWFGLLGLLTLPISLAVTEFARRRLNVTDSRQTAWALIATEGLLIGGAMLFAFAQSVPVGAVAVILISLTRQVGGPIHIAWLNQHIESKSRATVISLYSQANALGQIGGGPIIGLIGNMSVRVALALGALLLLPDLALYRGTMKGAHEEVAEGALASE